MVGYRCRAAKPTTVLWALVLVALLAAGGAVLVSLFAVFAALAVGGYMAHTMLSNRHPVPALARRPQRIPVRRR